MDAHGEHEGHGWEPNSALLLECLMEHESHESHELKYYSVDL